MPEIGLSTRHFSCYLIGDDTLAIQCAQILLQKGHSLLGVISNNEGVKAWTQKHGVVYQDELDSLTSTQFDYLFSIVNDRILPAFLTKSPNYFAINYHDALLPKYAGTHATSWTILNNEKQHGITWHVMDDLINGGDIVKQTIFDIDENETALTLNLKCYEQAIQSFAELVDELTRQIYQRVPQDLAHRTYFGATQKPSGNGWISWHQSAATINRLCRALNFGSYPNRLSTAKFILGKEFFIAIESFLSEKNSQLAPGTVVKIEEDYLQLTTDSCDIVISKIQELNGKSCSVSEICQRNNVTIGTKLISPSKDEFLAFAESSQKYSKNESFWLKELENFKTVDLPYLARLNAASSQQQNNYGTFTLKPEVYQKINSILSEQATVSEILLTVWLIYLYRIGNQQHLGLGYTTDQLQTIDNFIASSLPLTINFDDGIDFISCLKLVKQQLAMLQINGSYLKDIYCRYPTLRNQPVKFPLTVTLSNHIEKLKNVDSSIINILIAENSASLNLFGQINNNKNLEIFLRNISGHLGVMLNTIVENPTQKIAYLPLLTEKESQAILIDWNRTEVDFPRDKTVHQLFEEQVAKTPDNIAVIFEDQQLTYRELNERANQLANYLRKVGVKPEILVAICVERGLEMIVGILGILKSDGAYVPIDPEYPGARIRYILEDCQAPIVITQRSLLQRLQWNVSLSVKVISIDPDEFSITQQSTENLKSTIKLNNLIYIIYTSGSTGKPKGVMVEHASVVNFLLGVKQILAINAMDCFLATTSFCFDISVLELCLPFLVGAKFVIAKRNVVLDGMELQNLIALKDITILQTTPSLWQILFESGWKNRRKIKILCGGEVLDFCLASKFLLDKSVSYNLYGPTEATIWSTFNSFTEAEHQGSVPIGKPLPNQKVYALDRNLQPLPIGVSGQLYLGGLGLARGYLNQKKLTEENFITVKWLGLRIYKTGDQVCWLPDGNLEFIGRGDNQVKIRGHRVELEEIENALLKHPDIIKVVSFMTQEGSHQSLLAFYVVKENFQGKNISTQELYSFLKTLLPNYAIPNSFIQVKKIPLTHNGKTNREELLALVSGSIRNSNHLFIEQLTPKELILVNIWRDKLKVEQLSIRDNFFDLGGDSIIAMQIVASARSKGLQISVKDIFTHPCIAELFKILNSSPHKEISEPLQTLHTEVTTPPIRNTYPLTPMQKGLLFHTLCSPESGSYIIQLHWQFEGCLHIDKFIQSLQILTDRHDILRTCFHLYDLDEPMQTVIEKVEIIHQQYDWHMLSKRQQNERLIKFLEEDRRAGFNLSSAPIRLTIIRLSKNVYQIILTVHHILVDGWSLAIFFRELNIIYQSLCQNKIIHLSQPPQFRNYVQWLKKQDLISAKNFWQEYLSGFLEPTDLVIAKSFLEKNDSDRPAYQIEYKVLSQKLLHRLKKFSRIHQVTLSTLFQCAWAILLSRYSQIEDVVFGITMSGRPTELSHADQMLGIFINTLPLRVKLTKDLSIINCMKKIQDSVLDIAQYHYTPLKNVEEWSEISSGTNLFRSILVFENYPKEEDKQQVFKFSKIKIIDPTHYSLMLCVLPEKNSLKFCYDNNQIPLDAIIRLSGHIETLLTEMMIRPNQLVSEIKFLTRAEYQQILINWNKTQTEFPRDKTVHQLFEEQVIKSPNAIAVVFEDQQLTYYELNNRANQLAHYLKKLIVKPETLIALCIKRSLGMIISILAILKAGGAYVPIDPEYPEARIRYMLEDCRSPIIITQQSLYQSLLKNVIESMQVVLLDQVETSLSRESHENLQNLTQSKSLIYVIYTSGSTGKPKGVMIEHCSVVNCLLSISNKVGIHERIIFLAVTSISFDVSILDYLLPFSVGGCVVMANDVDCKDGIKLKNLLLRHKISGMQATPSTWHMLSIAEWIGYENFIILTAGEALSRELACQLKKRGRVFNIYGPTETTIYATYSPLSSSNQQITIGKSLANVNAYVLDNQLHPLPVGVIGELYIGGVGLARGYLNQSKLTREKFITNPIFSDSKSLLYKTGDLVRWLGNGELEYMGRIDNQVKVRGYRIELGEIEAQLESWSEIDKAVVMVRGNENVQIYKYLTAYLITKNNVSIDLNALQLYLRKYLPFYMIPTGFVTLEEFPLTPSGKIDRQSLPEPNRDQLLLRKYITPRTEEECALVEIWKEVLAIEKIGITDNFFALGGHSLSALEVLLKIYKKFAIEIPLRAIFDMPTIVQLAEHIQQIYNEQTALNEVIKTRLNDALLSPLVSLQPLGRKPPLFLIHPIGGTVFCYIPMLKYLNLEQPCYGIQDPGIETNDVIFKSIEEMATLYISVIQGVQPHGPYLVGGASSGSTICVEIARQLLEMGECIAFIAILDGWVPRPDNLRNQAFFEASMRRQFNQMSDKYAAIGIDRVEKLLKLQWQRMQLLEKYIVPHLNTKLTLFKASDIISLYKFYEEPFNHWEHYSPHIEVHHIPGNHETIFQEPNVRVLARQLNICLENISTKIEFKNLEKISN